MRPPLTYYGGKQRLSGRILPLIPKHTLYCEPFFGGGAIYFLKEPSKVEVINDTNGDLLNFYEVLKENPKPLIKEIQKTLYAREHHQSAKIVLGYPDLFDKVKRAWAIWVLANESYSSMLNGPWGFERKNITTVRRLNNKRNAFNNEYAERLENTQIECCDALEVIERMDDKESFFYCDPPYFNSDMGHYKGYTKDDFEKLLQILSKIKGRFLLSSYPSDILKKYIKKNKWHSKKFDMPISVTGNKTENSKQRKVEVLTANYPT